MEYDWQPDGSGKNWDNKTASRLPVTSARFTFPLAAASNDDPDDEANAASLPPTRTQLSQLSERMKQLL